jgi:hypothetical protein
MRMQDLILVSVDDHLVEPPGMFDGRLASKYMEDGPRFITRPNGTNAWVFEGAERSNIALNSVAGRRPPAGGIRRRADAHRGHPQGDL